MIRPWQNVSRLLRESYRVFQVREDRSISPRTQEERSFYVIEADNWVNIIPITTSGQMVFVRQYRHGTESITLEIPGGVADPTDTSLADAARREMLEETGYDTGTIIPLGYVAPNPAIQNNHCHSFLALGAENVAEQNLDGGEDIEVVLLDPEEVASGIVTGDISHALVVVAFYLFEHYKKTHPDWQQQ